MSYYRDWVNANFGDGDSEPYEPTCDADRQDRRYKPARNFRCDKPATHYLEGETYCAEHAPAGAKRIERIEQ